MYNLYFKKKQNKLVPAVEKPFQTEDELEKYIMDAREIFSDIFILKRQVYAGNRRDIPDIVGIDRDNNVVIVENKNVTVTEEILSQILRYAFWAETNPDSIKAMWLETENRPEDIEIEWDNVNIRVIVLAPSIRLSVTRLLKKINYAVELVVVRRFLVGDEEVILLHKFEEESEIKTGPTKGMSDYSDPAVYKTSRNIKSVDVFFKVVDEIDGLVKKNGWNLEKKFNKNYMGFKTGFPNVFGVQWLGSKSFGLFFKTQPSDYPKIKKLSPYEMEYDERWKQATFKYDEKVEIKKLEPVFEAIYKLFMEK